MSATEKLTDKLAARLPVLGDRVDRSPVVAAVRLHGVITASATPMARHTISLQNSESALTKAFAHDRLAAVALLVNSPGGAPTQSALVAERVRGLAAEKNVPVLAFCEDIAASGGYWLACAADEIYAHRTSLVGGIGVVTSGFGMDGLIERFGVQRRIHTAGTHKVRLDPFQPEDPEDVVWLRGLQDELHDQFRDWVTERRAGKLREAEPDLFSGEVWTGTKALELGLVDGLGTLREVVGKRFPRATITVAEPRRPLLARLGLAGPGGATRSGGGALVAEGALAAVEALEHRAIWSRFGL